MSDVSVSTAVSIPGPTSLRLTVEGPAGALDLAVPQNADARTVAVEYAERLGLPAPPVLVTTTGRSLDQGSLSRAGVAPGDVLVAVDADLVSSAGERSRPAARRSAPSAVRIVLVAGAVAAAALVAAAGVLAPPGPHRSVAVGVLALAALVASLAANHGSDALATAHAMAAPAFAAGAAFVLVHQPSPGGHLLAVAAAGLAAAVAGAVARAGSDLRTERLLRVWIVTGGVVAVSAALALAAGAPERALWSWLFVVAVAVARLLPHLVIDVPDETLVDLERLAVTAWSARERPRGSRRRRVAIRPDGVAELVRRGRELLTAGSAAVAAVATTSAMLLALAPGEGLSRVGVLVLLGAGGAALLLGARSYRAAGPRAANRLPGTVAVLAVAGILLTGLSGPWLWWALAALGVTAGFVVVAASALGRGWRSVWWARTGDVLEATGVVLCVGALPLATGLFDLVRQLTS